MWDINNKEQQYLDSLRRRFPFLAKKTQEELFDILKTNVNREPWVYEFSKFYFYEKNLLKKLTTKEKKDIIKKRAERYFNKGWITPLKDAYERSESEMMPTEKYDKYSKIAQYIFDKMWVRPNNDNLFFSTNRHGEHSWYLYFWFEDKKYAIRISDHFVTSGWLFTKDEDPIVDTIVVDYENNKFYEMDFDLARLIVDDYGVMWCCDVMDNIFKENATLGLEEFLRGLKLDLTWEWLNKYIDAKVLEDENKVEQTDEEKRHSELKRKLNTYNKYKDKLYQSLDEFISSWPVNMDNYDNKTKWHIWNLLWSLNIRKNNDFYSVYDLKDYLQYWMITEDLY